MTPERVLCLAAALLSCSLVIPAVPAVAADWPKQVFNPKPAPDDVMLPLPCGGSLALRRVVTDALRDPGGAARLTDKQISLGRTTDGVRGYIENRRDEHIAGPIVSTAGDRFYYIGKYEISVAQYRAVMAATPADCPARLTPDDALPQRGVSWYDAIDFTRRLNGWIYADATNGLASLVALDVIDGYVRLPSETEWEFAARGGLAVSDAARADPRYPMADGIDAHAWYNGPRSAQGAPRPIGLRAANPLMLHDVYGNVAELVLDPFRMTRADRLHGQIGGTIARGGSYLDPAEAIGSATRDEYPFFSRAGEGELRAGNVGFRIVIGTAAIGADADIDGLETAARSLQREGGDPQAPDPTAALALLEKDTENRDLKASIGRLKADLDAEFARRNELERAALRSDLVAAALMAFEMQLRADLARFQRDTLADPTLDPAFKADYRTHLDRNIQLFDTFAPSYTDLVMAMSRRPEAAVRDEAVAAARELSARGHDDLLALVDLAARQAIDYRKGTLTETVRILDGVVGTDRDWR
ncbi:formylglycine-generating enzyme family protein [Methylobrevis pamukkalensis]|uniref:Formylglycine-generating sulfatase enzyme n=1 Tax=Methylobrevis pamukkalensis TaxID=1439726 RepID=A0A1E3H5B1_9HYPH|nr:SUMF1/EgtB/PvdO family nonheme iron enzyme [Methylobrevis pamukkalensis]ODN70701.1 Formylglycine-generating sulfatase enzyme [Methylobrevis pamukkalensis]